MRIRDENKKARVRQKAIEMLVKEGLNGFSMQKLAKAANVSPATLYIYYKDKDDLIVSIGIEESLKMKDAMMEGFDSSMPFEEGLRIQWKNRSAFWLKNPQVYELFELLSQSVYRMQIFEYMYLEIREKMGAFVKNAVKQGWLQSMPVEVYWSLAFAPLNNLIRFHVAGRSLGNKPFVFSEKIMWQTFDLVVKAFKPMNV